MSVELIMPKAGLTNTDGVVGEWKFGEGDWVERGQSILEIENEKVTMEYEAPAAGFLHIIAQTGETVLVGHCMGWLAADREEYSMMSGVTGVAPADYSTTDREDTVSECAEHEAGAADQTGRTMEDCAAESRSVKASPLARKLASEAGADIGQITGSGPAGRIVAGDVEAYLQNRGPAAAVSSEKGEKRSGGKDGCVQEEPVRIPMTSVRRAVAERMYRSLHSMAQTSDSVEVDATELTILRRRLVEQRDKIGARITLGDMLARATVKMLDRHPLGNASIDENEIVTYPYVNLSMAVATDYGLTSPVVKNADRMSLTELSLALKDVAARARENRLTSEDLSGGTVTVTNMGIYPVDCFNAIINPPQSLIVGFGRAVEKPAVYAGEIAVRTMMWVSVTYDHRVFDGSEIGAIMADLKKYIENPDLILL